LSTTTPAEPTALATFALRTATRTSSPSHEPDQNQTRARRAVCRVVSRAPGAVSSAPLHSFLGALTRPRVPQPGLWSAKTSPAPKPSSPLPYSTSAVTDSPSPAETNPRIQQECLNFAASSQMSYTNRANALGRPPGGDPEAAQCRPCRDLRRRPGCHHTGCPADRQSRALRTRRLRRQPAQLLRCRSLADRLPLPPARDPALSR